MNKEALGKFIAENRKALGMTQEELANKLFITNKAVSKWEKGQSFPDIALFEPLAEALGVSVAELIACEKEAEEEASIKEIIGLSREVIKKYKARLTGAMITLALIAFCAGCYVFAEIESRMNFDYLYWHGWYWVVTNEWDHDDREWELGEQVGTIREAGWRNKNNLGGDSNCAEPGSGIYTVVNHDGTPYEGGKVLAVKVGDRWRIARVYYEDRSDIEKFHGVNIKEGALEKGFTRLDDYY
ncbi:MAG: helix-turn-helix transcriptional regulator [Oscillospiraceae bacterium]|nr:helix-turn-helix transcriptional regulator [Oscillospiraceae bacterium]